MDVLDIVIEKIVEHPEADSLCNAGECGCGLDYIAACEDGPFKDCVLAKQMILTEESIRKSDLPEWAKPGTVWYFPV